MSFHPSEIESPIFIACSRSLLSVKDGVCKLWTAKVANEAPLLLSAINHSLHVFGHDRLKPVQSEAVQALLQGQDIFVNIPAGCRKSLICQVLPAHTALILKAE